MGLQLSDIQFRVAVSAGAAAVAIGISVICFCGDVQLPPKPPRPQATLAVAEEFSENVARSSGAYEAYLQRDSDAFAVRPVAELEQMSAAFSYRVDRDRHVLEPGGDPIEVLDLRLSLTAEAAGGSPKKHMVLQIENLADTPLAYRVQTRPTRGERSCSQKSEIPHNAIALPVGGIVRRTECLYKKGYELQIQRVETMALPLLAYFYASSVQPDRIDVDLRTSRGHQAPSAALKCTLFQTAELERALEEGQVTWRDLVDYYARHRCETYTFPIGYRAFRKDRERTLPVVSE